jgi:hypothetical protein
VLVVKTQRGADVPATVGTRVVGFVETMLGIDARLEVLGADGLVPPEVKVPKATKFAEKGTLDRADEAALQAQKLAEKKRWAEALKGWTKAIALYEKGLAQMKDVAPYARALSGRAYAYFGQGYDDNGEDELALAFAMKADLEVDASAPPNAVAVFERVRARVRPTGALLTVNASAAGAVVFVDGRMVGPAPAVVGELPRGAHVVRVVAADHEAFGQLVTMGDEAVEVVAALVSKPGEPGVMIETAGPKASETGLEGYAASGDFGAGFQSLAKGLAKANRLDFVLWTYARKQGEDFELAAFAWDAATGRVGAIGSVPVSGDLGGLQVTVLDLMEKAGAMMTGQSAWVAVSGRPAVYEQAKPDAVAITRVAEGNVKSGDGGVKSENPESDKSGRESDKSGRESDKPPVREPQPEKVADTVLREPKRDPNEGKRGPYEVPPMRKPPVVPREARDQGDEGPAFYQSWWFWTLVTGLAAGGATAYILSTDGSDGPGGFRTTVTW